MIDPIRDEVFLPREDGVAVHIERHALRTHGATDAVLPVVHWTPVLHTNTFGESSDSRPVVADTAGDNGWWNPSPEAKRAFAASPVSARVSPPVIVDAVVQFTPNVEGLLWAIDKRGTLHKTDDALRAPRFFVTAHVTSSYHLPMDEHGGPQELSFRNDATLEGKLSFGASARLPSNTLVHVSILLATSTREDQRVAMTVLGDSECEWKTCLAGGGAAQVVRCVYFDRQTSNDVVLGSLKISGSLRVGHSSVTYAPAIDRLPHDALQRMLEKAIDETHQAAWKRHPVAIKNPNGQLLRTEVSRRDDSCIVLGYNMPRMLFFVLASQFDIANDVVFAESNVLLGCLAAGVPPATVTDHPDSLSEAEKTLLLCTSGATFARAMSTTYDYRGSSMAAPFRGERLDLMSGACVELTSFITSAYQSIARSASNSKLCRVVATLLAPYRVVQVVLVSRARYAAIGSDVPSTFHLVVALMPESMFQAMTGRASSVKTKRPTCLLVDGLINSAFGKTVLPAGHAVADEADRVQGTAYTGETAFSQMWTAKGSVFGSCTRITSVSGPGEPLDMVCLTNGSVGIDSEALFSTGVEAGVHTLESVAPAGTYQSNSSLMKAVRPAFDEVAHLRTIGALDSSRGLASRASVIFSVLASKLAVRVPPTSSSTLRSLAGARRGWRVFGVVKNDGRNAASVGSWLSLSDALVNDDNAKRRDGVLTSIKSGVAGSFAVYGGCECYVCYFVYDLA